MVTHAGNELFHPVGSHSGASRPRGTAAWAGPAVRRASGLVYIIIPASPSRCALSPPTLWREKSVGLKRTRQQDWRPSLESPRPEDHGSGRRIPATAACGRKKSPCEHKNAVLQCEGQKVPMLGLELPTHGPMRHITPLHQATQ